jgi:hypothetical protein
MISSEARLERLRHLAQNVQKVLALLINQFGDLSVQPDARLLSLAEIIRLSSVPHGIVYLRTVHPVELSRRLVNVRCGQPET